MTTMHRNSRSRRLATALALSMTAVFVAGCGADDAPGAAAGDGAEPGAAGREAPVEAPRDAESDEAQDAGITSAYEGPYDEDFRTEASSYAGQQVTLTGEVAEMVPSRSSLILADPENPELDPLLVSAQFAFPEAEEGSLVEVTGTFLTNFEARVDQDDQDDEAGFYDRHIGEPYLDEAQLATADPAGP